MPARSPARAGMSAIAGLYYPATPKPVDPARLTAMADAMTARGPDGGGVWTAAGVGFGHRRLAAIDPAGSPQPMLCDGGALAIVRDGAIHNHRDLRRDLKAMGHDFATDGDAEVLLAAWRQWGPAMLDRLIGTFAIAIHDARTNRLFLARDRLGVKPLHYVTLADGALAFASELKGLLAHPLVRRRPDLTAVEDYLALGHVPDDACLVAGVRKLPAGCFLLVERGRDPPAPRRWWDVSFADRARGSTADLGAELLDRMRDGVGAAMVADVPPGALLSGDMAGAAVVALMAEASARAVSTRSIADGKNGRGFAGTIARRFATDHRTGTVDADDAGPIDRLVAAFDEPFGYAPALAGYRLCRLARETVTIALTGEGTAVAMAGGRHYRAHVARERLRGLLPAVLRARIAATLGRAPVDGDDAYARAVTVTDPAIRATLWSETARRALADYRAGDRYVAAMREAPARDAIDRAQYADLRIRLPGDILTRMDRTSMAASLEARAPLLDHRVVEFAATLPASLRLRRGEGEWLMRRTLAPYLPREILRQRETGVAAPIGAWCRGVLADEAAALARSRTLGDIGWFDLVALGGLAEAHRDGRADHGAILWQFVMLERSLARLSG